MFATGIPPVATPSFQQDLDHLRNPPPQSGPALDTGQHIELVGSIIEMLCKSHPGLSQDLLALKACVLSWSDEVTSLLTRKNKEILTILEDNTCMLTQEVGIVLEEIGAFLRSLSQQYFDRNLKRYYAKYLLTVKQLRWPKKQPPPSTKVHAVQTEIQVNELEIELKPEMQTEITLSPTLTSIESPSPVKYRARNKVELFLSEKNEEMEQKISELADELNRLEMKIRELTGELAREQDKVDERDRQIEALLRENEELRRMLDELREQERLRLQREGEELANRMDLEALRSNLQKTEEQLRQAEHKARLDAGQISMARNYRVVTGERSPTKKDLKGVEGLGEGAVNDLLRLLVVQATSLQSFILQG